MRFVRDADVCSLCRLLRILGARLCGGVSTESLVSDSSEISEISVSFSPPDKFSCSSGLVLRSVDADDLAEDESADGAWAFSDLDEVIAVGADGAEELGTTIVCSGTRVVGCVCRLLSEWLLQLLLRLETDSASASEWWRLCLRSEKRCDLRDLRSDDRENSGIMYYDRAGVVSSILLRWLLLQ